MAQPKRQTVTGDDWFHILQGINPAEYRRRRKNTMTKDTRAKPSPTALRAAGAIYAYMLPKDQLDDKVCYYLAEIIDRETGVAELSQQVANLQRANDKLVNPERDKLARELAEAWLSPATNDHTPEQLDEVARELLRRL